MRHYSFFLCTFLLAELAGAEPRKPAAFQQSIRFEANQGQTDKRVKFLARTGSYRLFLTDQAAVIAPNGDQSAGLTIRLVDVNRAPTIIPLDEQPGVSNYLIGGDPTKWVTGVRQYAKVRYEQVYPGVDLIYYGKGQQLENDFIVAPGADYRRIRLRFEGAKSLRLVQNGDLVIQSAHGELRQIRPVIYQEISGERRRIRGNYRLIGQDVSFHVDAYDASQPLIIDPTYIYFSTYLGGSGTNQPNSIAADSQGNAYTTGSTTSLDFPVKNAVQPANGGMTDVFVTKLDGTSGAILYSTYIGGNNNDTAHQIKVDGSGNAYIIGTTSSTNFPTTKGAFQTTLKGPSNAFAAKLNATGNTLTYATYLGGSGGEVGRGIDLDSSGDAYLVGVTYSGDFPVKGTSFGYTPLGGGADAFLTEINPTGTALIYSGYMGGSGYDVLESVAVNSLGEANVVGYTNSADLPTSFAGSRWPNLTGVINGFMAKVSPGNSGEVNIEYISYYGGSNVDILGSISVDPADDVTVYIAGVTSSADFPTPNALPVDLGTNPAVPFAARFQLPGIVFVQSVPTRSHAASADDYTWWAFSPSDCGGNDWEPVLKNITNDVKTLEKITGDLQTIIGDFLPQWASLAKDLYALQKDVAESCPASSKARPALSLIPEAQPASPQPIFAVEAADGTPVDFPQPPVGTLGASTTYAALAGSPAAASATTSIYMAIQTNDATLPVSASGANPSGGATNGYIVELSATPPTPTVAGVVNGASFAASQPVAPGSLISIFGNFAGSTTAQASSTPLPVSLGSTSLTINGTPVPMYFVNNGQINAQVPWNISAGPANVVVTSGGVASAPLQFTVAPTNPGIFVFGSNRAVAQNQDYSVNNTGSPAAVGSVITVYLTGGGAVSQPIATGAATPSSPLANVTAPNRATIGGQSATIEFLGMTPGLVGVVQADIEVPALSSGDYPLIITIGGVQSNAPLVTVAGN